MSVPGSSPNFIYSPVPFFVPVLYILFPVLLTAQSDAERASNSVFFSNHGCAIFYCPVGKFYQRMFFRRHSCVGGNLEKQG